MAVLSDMSIRKALDYGTPLISPFYDDACSPLRTICVYTEACYSAPPDLKKGAP